MLRTDQSSSAAHVSGKSRRTNSLARNMHSFMSNGEGRELSVNKSFAELNNSTSEPYYDNPGDYHSTNSDIFSALPGTLMSLRPTNYHDDTK